MVSFYSRITKLIKMIDGNSVFTNEKDLIRFKKAFIVKLKRYHAYL